MLWKEGAAMRRPVEYIEELKAVAEDFAQRSTGRSEVYIIVGFEDHADFVSSLDPHPLRRLSKLMLAGGAPIGWWGFAIQEIEGQEVPFAWSGMLEEYAHDPVAIANHRLFVDTLNRGIEKQPGLTGVPSSKPG
jgi:hypothetical protein